MTSECLGLYHGREDDTRVSHGDGGGGGCGEMLIHKQIGCCCNGVTFNRMGRPLFHALTDEQNDAVYSDPATEKASRVSC